MPFANSILGGNDTLIRTAIKSPNFVHDVSGWSIDKNGNAEFNSIILPPGTGGNHIFYQSATPTADAVNDLWFNTTAGKDLQVTQWNGSAWVPYQFGTGAIVPGSITASLIQANTITAAQLAAGIIYAGIVNGTTITGANIIADGTSGQILCYTGTPAFGNLISSVSPVAFTDAKGNAVLAGNASYDFPSGGGFLGFAAVLSGSGELAFYLANTAAGPWTAESAVSSDAAGTLQLLAGASGEVNVAGQLTCLDQIVFGGGVFIVQSTGKLAISGGGLNPLVTITDTTSGPSNPNVEVINNAAGDNSIGVYVSGDTKPRGLITSDGAHWAGVGGSTAPDTKLAYRNAGTVALTESSGLDGTVVLSKTSTASNAVTGTGATQLGATFTIPAGDANVGTVYRYKCSGTGIQATTTAVSPTIITSLASTNVNQIVFTAGQGIAAGNHFDWELEITLEVITTGSGGTCRTTMSMTMNVNSAGVSTSNMVRGVRQATAVAINTTVSNTLQLNGQWSSATNSPTITGNMTTFERLGP